MSNFVDGGSPTEPVSLPLFPAESVRLLGSTAIITPHPDDQLLGCGGVIALLAKFEIPIHIVVMSDSAGLHSGAVEYPPNPLQSVRQREITDPLRILGVSPGSLSFLNLSNEQIPSSETRYFSAVVEALRMVISVFAPSTIIVPWRRDRHCDHKATWEIAQTAVAQTEFSGRWMEYAAWLVEPGDDPMFPEPGEMDIFRFDISSVLEQKREAIACHRSWTIEQTGEDSNCSRLNENALGRDNVPWEVFLESYHD
jgi:LmbE family N-acetylglucosaminyl deacetylase